VWTTLVVRLWYSQEFEHRELWRNAAEFASTRGNTLGLLIKKTGDGDATISLYFDVEVPDELKVIFIEYVHRQLARYACDVARDRRYVCSECAKPVTDLDAVRKRLEATKDFIYCQGCDAKVPLIDFIQQRLKSDPVARKILPMDETATREQDAQALEQILIGHIIAIAGEANQIFRPVTMRLRRRIAPRDIQVPLAPSGSRRVIPLPRPSCAHLRYFAIARAQAHTMT
jgi:DNA-directed RNA polymerase subunit RPC12/RpoP